MIFKTLLLFCAIWWSAAVPLEEPKPEVPAPVIKPALIPQEAHHEVHQDVPAAADVPVPAAKTNSDSIDRKDVDRIPEGIESIGASPDANPAAPNPETASDLETANSYYGGWGGYYRRPYYGYGGGWRRGWGGYGGGYGGWGGGYGRGFGGGYGGYGGGWRSWGW